jgi:trehalose 6-phosphate synthase
MGFFLHIPFPPSRLMVSLPFHEGLVLSMLAYDVIGFQTEEWLESFRHYVERELGGPLRAGRHHPCRRPLRPCRRLSDRDRLQGVQRGGDGPRPRAVLRAPEGERGRPRTIIGVDRLDYSQGLEERFLGYRRFPGGA